MPGLHFPNPLRRPLARSCRLLLLAAAGRIAVAGGAAVPAPVPVDPAPAAVFHREIQPILEDYCYDCHGDGSARGKVAFDTLSDADLTARPELWLAALKNLRANIMPPAGKPRPSPAEAAQIAAWIKYSAFGIHRADPDPGRVTLRRLNRVEYGRTIKTLLGVDFPSEAELPPDDTGHGFDNIGDVLSVSPLLLEKYLQAAESIVTGVVPGQARSVPVTIATGRDFRALDPGEEAPGGGDRDEANAAIRASYGRPLNFSRAETVAHRFTAPRDARYRLTLDLEIRGPFNYNPGRCLLTIKVDGTVRSEETVAWQMGKPRQFALAETWRAGEHEVSIGVAPLPPLALPTGTPPPDFDDKQPNEIRIVSVRVQGPFGRASSVETPGYRKFFPRGEPAAADREAETRTILAAFASRAYRRPVDEATLGRLVRLARGVEEEPGGSFEVGVQRGMMAILASPRFLFRFEQADPADAGARFPRIDEYSLASRLSYFLWSTMPDEELLGLAQRGELRPNLRAQVARMLRDPQAAAFVHNFTGQWLQARDVEFVPINAAAVLGVGRADANAPKVNFDAATRRAMRDETEMDFDYVMRGDRSVLEWIESDYTFLNETLAKVYDLPGVSGKKMRLVTLPPGSFRGGFLTQGTVLTVTSNPTRTSPVKRGQFILQNILGTPTPPPPPNIPALEEAKAAFGGRTPTLREMLAVHRQDAICSSCHERMDPLGLALENFNALGHWRDHEEGQPIAPAGELVSGEKFQDVRELKHLITHQRRADYYRCLTEKLLTYALGRGLEYGDVATVDRIVDELERDGGRFSTLLVGVIESAPFQKQRRPSPVTANRSEPSSPLALLPAP